MLIINDFIDEKPLHEITHALNTQAFPWYYYQVTCDALLDRDDSYCVTPFMRHSFIKDGEINSSEFDVIKPILLGIENLFSGRTVRWNGVHSNLVLPNDSLIDKLCPPHVDIEYEQSVRDKYDIYTGLFYIHDSDGNTVLYNQKFDGAEHIKLYRFFSVDQCVKPKKNRLVLWDADTYHSAPASASIPRIVINLNFTVEK